MSDLYDRINNFCCLSAIRNKDLFKDTDYKTVYDLVDDLSILKKKLESLDILKLVLGLNATNRAIIRQAYESGWITEEQVNLLKEELGL